jgi:hypothetical protein
MLGKCIKKFDVLSIKEERKMLASYISQLTSLCRVEPTIWLFLHAQLHLELPKAYKC